MAARLRRDGGAHPSARLVRDPAWSRRGLAAEPAHGGGHRARHARPGPATVLWGPAHVQLYSDAYVAIAKDRHPALLGRPVAEGWPDAYEGVIAPLLDAAHAGRATRLAGIIVALRDPDGQVRERVFDTAWSTIRDEAGSVAGVLQTLAEVTDGYRAQRALQASQDRQAFLLQLSDALRPIGDPVEVQRAATRMLGEHLKASRVFYVEVDKNGDTAAIWGDFTDGVASRVGRYSLSAFSTYAVGEWRAGRTASSSDVNVDPRYSEAERRAYASVSTRAGFGIPLIKEGQLVALLGVNQSSPRAWSDYDIGMASDVAERTWAAVGRARAEAGLRESEQKYQRLFETANDGFWWSDGEGYIREANQGIARMLGCRVEDFIGLNWKDFVYQDPDSIHKAERRWAEGKAGGSARFEYRLKKVDGSPLWAAVSRLHVLDEQDRHLGDLVAFRDITQQKRAEAALRESEERQAFLLGLTDALRPLLDPVEIQETACRIVGEHLGSDWSQYSPVDLTRNVIINNRDYYRAGAPSNVGEYDLAVFPIHVQAWKAGRSVAVPDFENNMLLSDGERAGLMVAGVRAALSTPLVKDGELTVVMSALSSTPRPWSEEEAALLGEVADRTWAAVERARAEAAFRASEGRFRQFADASSGALWVRNAETLEMEYVSPAIVRVYGVEPAEFMDGVERWAAAIVPEDRPLALEHLEQARAGEAVVHEFRIQRASDRAFRWIRNTDFPLRDEHGRVERIGGIAEDVTEAKLLAEHQGVLLHELQHRVRNIMAKIRAITARTGERAESVPAYAALMAGRLLTLARVQALLTRGANVGVGIRTIVVDELAAQAQHEGQYVLDGPDLELAPKAAEVLTLAVHELITNALKYGALSVPDGRVTVRWATFDRGGTSWLVLDWTEEGAPERAPPDPSVPQRRGFGSELIEGRIPYELGGRGKVTIGPGGAQCHLEFPLEGGASVLETDAPRRGTVFGGALDMAGEVDLSGQRILVVEDDYYLATDTARAVQGAGAEVLGPCPSERAALGKLADGTPTGAMVDINLGRGPSFVIARELKARGVPFVFTTGYDPEVIPPEFGEVERLQKPVDLRQVVGSLGKALGAVPEGDHVR